MVGVDLTPNTLVIELAKSLSRKEVPALYEYAQAVTKAEQEVEVAEQTAEQIEQDLRWKLQQSGAAPPPPPPDPPGGDTVTPQKPPGRGEGSPDEPEPAAYDPAERAREAAVSATTKRGHLATKRSELAGRLATASTLPELHVFDGYLGGEVKEGCVLLYRDPALSECLLVQARSIVQREPLEDRTSGLTYDRIWVNADAPVKHGSGSSSVDARWLQGDFTRAGETEAALGGGTFSALTGAFLGDYSAVCCTRRSIPGRP